VVDGALKERRHSDPRQIEAHGTVLIHQDMMHHPSIRCLELLVGEVGSAVDHLVGKAFLLATLAGLVVGRRVVVG
jgi:hypothetical protein